MRYVPSDQRYIFRSLKLMEFSIVAHKWTQLLRALRGQVADERVAALVPSQYSSSDVIV